MSNIAIRASNIGKRFNIGTRDPYLSLRDLISRRGNSDQKNSGHIWALKDVNFEVKEGEVLGIIGRNGAGKSTLLKILSRITPPTTGQILINGRVASLLEVGTGFHSELTGRENIFLNGSILGMRRSEIVSCFNDIVDFSEIGQFLDTPVKRYSSGMYMRLAFAVAAHLNCEILLIDEVLAVGDAEFQKKCLGKMNQIAKGSGKTVLFVSHNMPAIRNLCQNSIVLEQGKVAYTGATDKAIAMYLKTSEKKTIIPLEDRKDRRGNGNFKFVSVRVKSDEGEEVNTLVTGEDCRFIIKYQLPEDIRVGKIDISVNIDNQFGDRITSMGTDIVGETISGLVKRRGEINVLIKKLPLTPGEYGFTLFAKTDGDIADWIQNAGFISVSPGDFYKTGRLPHPTQGNFLLNYSFETNEA
jgi:lipopolysaccharide transport system ATP-binding protein